MVNKWLIHVAQFRKSHPNMIYKDVLKEAAKSYTKVPKKTMRGKGLGDDILSDIKEAKLGSKAVDYIKNKVEQGGYGVRRSKKMIL
jgi:hypothetical protein